MTVRYFGYGSNLNSVDVKARGFNVCLTDPILYKLDGWKIGFTKYTRSRGGGVANITKQAGEHCWGISFGITKHEMRVLDHKEGVCTGAYVRTCLSDGLYTYTVTKDTGFIQPSNCYLDVIIKGASIHGLPDEWLQHLESFRIRS